MRRPLPLWTPLLAGALALLFAPDCTGPETDAGAGGGGASVTDSLNTPDGVTLAAAVWTFAWDTEGASLPAKGGLDVTTDLGYEVHVDVGRVLTHSVAFGPCDSASSGAGGAGGSGGAAGGGGGTAYLGLPGFMRPSGREGLAEGATPGLPGFLRPAARRGFAEGATPGLPGFLRRLVAGGLPVRSAAAHTGGTEPSTVETSLIEDLTKPSENEASTSFTPARYCRAHWLLARPMTATHGPSDVPMDQRSLYVTGTFTRDGETTPFTIDTWWPIGSLQDLQDILGEEAYSKAREDGATRYAFVTVRRRLATLFDGIDFEVASKDQIAGRAIDNLAEGVRFEITLWRPGDPT